MIFGKWVLGYRYICKSTNASEIDWSHLLLWDGNCTRLIILEWDNITPVIAFGIRVSPTDDVEVETVMGCGRRSKL